jgi:hypothetical protein
MISAAVAATAQIRGSTVPYGTTALVKCWNSLQQCPYFGTTSHAAASCAAPCFVARHEPVHGVGA